MILALVLYGANHEARDVPVPFLRPSDEVGGVRCLVEQQNGLFGVLDQVTVRTTR